MAKKFNFPSFSTPEIDKKKEVENLKLGTGLLNQESSGLENKDKIELLYLRLDEIVPNPKNDLSISRIEELAELISKGGIEQPLVVRQAEDGQYILLTGHRRRAAIELLFNQGKWDKDRLIPCILKDIEREIDLPLSLDLKEDFSMLQTNQHREMTDADLFSESRRWKKIFDELRRQGVEMIPIGVAPDGTTEYQQIKGEKSRNLIAKQIGRSPALVGQHDAIDNKGAEELKEAILNNKISVYLANEVVSELDKEEQKKFVKEAVERKEEGEKINREDLVEFQKEKDGVKEEKEDREDKPDESKKITLQVFQDDTQKVSDLLKTGKVELNEKQYGKYLNAIRSLEKLFAN